MSSDIEYIEPTQEHVGQMVEVRDSDIQEWRQRKLLGIIDYRLRFVVEPEGVGLPLPYKHARIPRPLTYAERQAKCGLKVGDRVRIVREYQDFEHGYWGRFYDSMKKDVGTTGVITQIDTCDMPCVYLDNSIYVWPYFVLEKVTDRVAKFTDIGKTVYVEGYPQDKFTLDGHYISVNGKLYGVVVNNDKRFVYELSNLRVKE